ncbi:dynein regulatory complex subunit 3-like isoform X2 [Venturia canescens]|uniref:dynein regulatory complex subunit 3-like isoform X2 n=1 Tax=Venturia canescens TaxID=32260 RepID=UPI001C9D5D17|nr:dynein regulatory complex subunit 3-like isoform X2 [Venturia canescens]
MHADILKIDNLWILANSLTRLKLSNNAIEKIENLDCLVHLVDLDLSFNHIKTIENLESLVKLEVLLLYANEIQEVGGMDALTELTIFSIGANQIDDWDHVMYLRKFNKLRSLNVKGNSCTNKDGYIDYVVAFLPQIVYLNYKMLDETKRHLAQQKHQRAIFNLDEKESSEKADTADREAKRKRQLLLSVSYVEYLDGDELFRQMYQNDKEGKELSLLNEDTQDLYDEYEKRIMDLCRQLFEFGLREQEKRSEEIRLFEKTVDEGREAVHAEARTMMDEIIAHKINIFEELGNLLLNKPRKDRPVTKEVKDEDDIQEKVIEAQRLSDDFNDLLSKTWTRLMYREVILHEQMEETNEYHKQNMGDLVTNFTETARATFALMRDAEADYNDSIESLATIYANTFTDQIKMPDRHAQVCGDKNILSNCLTSSHDLHLQTVDAREDLLLSRIKTWYDEYTERLVSEEIERNRNAVLEISHFLEQQREEFDAIHTRLRSGSNDAIDADIVATLGAG